MHGMHDYSVFMQMVKRGFCPPGTFENAPRAVKPPDIGWRRFPLAGSPVLAPISLVDIESPQKAMASLPLPGQRAKPWQPRDNFILSGVDNSKGPSAGFSAEKVKESAALKGASTTLRAFGGPGCLSASSQ
jgi:hypothetical protein